MAEPAEAITRAALEKGVILLFDLFRRIKYNDPFFSAEAIAAGEAKEAAAASDRLLGEGEHEDL